MSSLAFLVTELQSLASETRRKHPEIREAAEKSLTILRASPEQATANLASDGPQSEDLLRPVFMGCATKNAKVVAISLGSLQRLIALKAVPQSAVPLIINTMSDAMSQGVDIQLRILQTLVSLVPNFPAIHGELLGDALLLCFKLQESRIAVVSSTAAATLRQLVMFVVDKMVLEDRIAESEEIPSSNLSPVTLPDGTTKLLGPSAKDAYSVFEDLCLLTNGEKPNFLKLEFLHKTFALELIESVLTNYHELFRKHPELVLLLRHHLCPLLLKSLSDRPQFPLLLRCTRVIFLLLKKFSLELQTEVEVFLMMLIRLISEDGSEGSDSQHHIHPSKPVWMRVLAMEVMRGLCSDGELIRSMWDRYDAQQSGSKVISSLITALKRLVTEKPALLGIGTQMGGVGVHSESAPSPSGSGAAGAAAYGLDMAGRVASATVSGVVTMIAGGGGLSLHGSSMKLQCIDQLDKADAPAIPESYIYLLGVQCIISLCEGFASFSGPIYSTIAMQRPRAAGDAVVRAPPALDLNTLPQDDPQTKQLRIVQSIISQAWPALLAALSFIIATNLSDELFVDVLASYQAMTNVSGMLGLTTPRDAFFNSLSKFAVPIRVVSSLEAWVEHPPPQTPRSATAALSEGLGLGGPTQPPGLSERNMACLKVLLGCSLFLAGSLGESWYAVLEALQNADGVLTMMAKTGASGATKKGLFNAANTHMTGGPGPSAGMPAMRSVSLSGSQASSAGGSTIKHPLLLDLDVETMQLAVQRLFDSSKNLEDSAFKDFVDALCKLSSEMVGMQTSEVVPVNVSESGEEGFAFLNVSNRSQESVIHRRRVSGIQIPKNLRAGDFGISKLGGVATLNIHRLIYRSPEIAWNTTTSHLLMIIRLGFAPQAIRIQAARVLDDILLMVPRNLSHTSEMQAQVQRRVLDVLGQQVVPDSSLPLYQQTSTSVELRRMGLETLHQILQAAGHTLVVGWEIIFQMLESVCRPASLHTNVTPTVRSQSTDSVSLLSSPPSPEARMKPLPLGLGHPTEKSYSGLVKIAFQSLTLVCDSVSSLSPEHLRLCISTLGQFGHQADTNIALTAAASLLWSVSDAIQSKRKNVDEEPEYSELWMFLLLEVLGLCTDSRAEVRDGAIQTLFRTMQLYGATLSLETWDQCIWKVTFPLLNELTSEIRRFNGPNHGPESGADAWDESKILALHSIGSIFNDFLVDKIMLLDSFTRAWDVFLGHIEETVLLDNRNVSAPALRSLEKAIKASSTAEGPLKVRVMESLERVWQSIDLLGASATKRYTSQEDLINSPHQPFTQESLMAFVDVIQSTRRSSRGADGKEWDLARLTRLMEILKGVLTYPNSPDYRPDIDALPPVQTAVMDTIADIDLVVPGSPSLVMRDLADYTTLPFLAAFDVQIHPKTPQPQTVQKRVSYIALSKKTMPMLVELFLKFKNSLEIYTDGTLEAILSAYSIPIKLKYDCPAPSKYGKDLPLWKTATTSFLRIVKECTHEMKSLDEKIQDDRIEGIWRQILDVFRGGILADCSSTESFSLEVQEAEENFDLALIASLEIDVVPHLGGSRIPDDLVATLGKILQKGSKIYEGEEAGSSRSSSISHNTISPRPTSIETTPSKESHTKVPGSPLKVEAMHLNAHYSDIGSTDFGSLLPRERFSYWCFDLLFLICSDITKDQEEYRKRLAALTIPSLLNRCRTTLLGFVADESLRGNMPFPRAREEELLYVLRKLLELRLWPGSLWAALSDNPTQYSLKQPIIGTDIPVPTSPRELISDSVKRTPIAHLFHLYPILCEIASIPRKGPSCWISLADKDSRESDSLPGSKLNGVTSPRNFVMQFDARRLASETLKEIGKEMGVSQ
ncbi:hypothetical protein BDN70DRAFT_825412 [Pholiota conissans]|uniref:Protein MON2 homolog n=1 Tax=Pholiota conissans TaxID=109636 RepID=A0A9P5ZDE1_9AGAR|nr:hypothetical protein BDN70DRAFT_825412 [Pholiota conissans]